VLIVALVAVDVVAVATAHRMQRRPSRSVPRRGGTLPRMPRTGVARSVAGVTGRISLLAVLAAAIVAVGAVPAGASLGDEVAAGAQVAKRVDAGAVTCSKLADSDFEHLGEYVMERMLGSRAAHRAMNDRMASMMGDANAERMHELLGRRFAGCAIDGAGAGTMMGPGMMGSRGAAAGGMGAMMASGDVGWMRGGAWRHMSRADWQRLGRDWMGPGMMAGSGSGWSTGEALAAVLGALALGGLAVLMAVRRPWRRRHAAGPAAT
jgi:hypothetical protein